jgi:hypothetical protein
VVFFYAEADTAPYLICPSNRKENPVSTKAKSVLRKYWKPALATGAGGTSILIWLEELILIWLDILSLVVLLLVAGPILLFNHFMFQSSKPRKEDKTQ